jgi:tRNA-2-methylthio-N6-dimethylallyladenosine synthase
LKILQDIQKKITLEFNKSSEGKIFTILADGISKKNSNELTGRSEDNRTVNFQGDRSLIGSFLKVKILKAYQNSLKGEIVDN